MKTKMVISEFRAYLIQSACIILGFLLWGVFAIVRDDLRPEFLFVIIIVLLPIIGIVIYHLRLLGTVWIYEDEIMGIYPLLRRGGWVSLEEPVYYAIYSETQYYYPQRYIMVSNKPIVFDGDSDRIIIQDYATQVKIPYNRKAKTILPYPDWTEIGMR